MALSVLGFAPIAAFAQGEVDVVQNATGLVIAIASILGAVGGIIVAVAGFLKSRGLIKEGDEQLYNVVMESGQGLQGTDRWIQENVDKINILGSVITNLSPEARKALEAQGHKIEEWKKDAEETKRELDRLYGIVPKA